MIPQKLNRAERAVETNSRLTLRFYQFLDALSDTINSLIGTTTTITAALMPVTEIDFTDSPYTIAIVSQTLICDCSAGNIVINLPSIVIDMQFNIIKADSSANTVTVNSADGIIGSASQVLNAQYDSLVLIAGSNEFYVR